MKNYLIRRILEIIPVFLFIVVLVFFLTRSAPGGPVSGMINPRMSPDQKAQITRNLGLDKPVYQQFFTWAKEVVKGNLGYSIKYQKPVTAVIGDFIWSTFILSFFSLLISLLIGVPAGIISATKQYTFADTFVTIFSLIGISLPAFFFALLLIKFFAIDHNIFPLYGMLDQSVRGTGFFKESLNLLWHLILPGTVLGLGSMASFTRYTRSAMLEVIQQDYIRTARSKGLKEMVIIYRHALRNAMIPIITLLGFWIPSLFSGAVLTETIFGWPGLGKISVNSIMARDYPLLMGVVMMGSILTLIGMLLADVLYAIADPRIKYE